jgi:thiol-disulfide isomerase/thioredoxin
MRTKGILGIFAILLTLSSFAGTIFADGAQDGRPWYASDLERLGFTVFDRPKAVADFSVQALDGARQSLSSLRGKIVILNFWATWCPPCRAEMPALDSLWKKNKDKAFVIMGVSLGEDQKTVMDFVAKAKYSYPIFLDQSGELGARFGARSIPTTYVFDKEGQAIAGKIGGAEYDGQQAIDLFAKLAAR